MLPLFCLGRRLTHAGLAFATVLLGACSSTTGSDSNLPADGGQTSASNGGNSQNGSGGNGANSSQGGSSSSGAGGSPNGSGNSASSGNPSGGDAGNGRTDGGASSSGALDASAPPAPVSCPVADAGSVSCSTPEVTQSFNAGLTFYQQTSANNCGMPWPSASQPQSGATMYTAFSTQLYDAPSGSGACGKCVQVNGQTLIVVDQCPANSSNPTCENANHLDLGGGATFTAVTGQSQSVGEIANSPGVNVKFVPCPVTGNIQYSFSTSTQQYYLAMIILNSKYGIQSVQYRSSGTCTWTATTARTDGDPNWVINSTVPNPIDFLVTDEWGHVLEDDNVTWVAGQNVTGHGQFPTCP